MLGNPGDIEACQATGDPGEGDPPDGDDPPGPGNDSNGDGIPDGVDVTEYTYEEMIYAVLLFAALDNNPLCGISMPVYINGCGGEDIIWLYSSHLAYFGNFSKFDIKRGMERLYGGATILCGQTCAWVDYSTAGNILFGFVAASRGIDQGVAAIAGGVLETMGNEWKPNNPSGNPFKDNPADQAAVDFGYSLWEEYGLSLTYQDFQNELTVDVLVDFQRPSIVPVAAPRPQPNVYPQGYFLDPVKPGP